MTQIKKPNEVSNNWQNFMELNLFPNSGTSAGTVPLTHEVGMPHFVGLTDLIKYVRGTSKTYLALSNHQQLTFDVDLRLSKPQIKKILENSLNVKVIAVNTHIPPRKNLRVGTTQGNRVRYKRAIITFKKGSKIEFPMPFAVNKTEV